jgi:hypothetical protein
LKGGLGRLWDFGELTAPIIAGSCKKNLCRLFMAAFNTKEQSNEALAKLLIAALCHSERNEKYRVYERLRSLTSFRMTKQRVLQEAQTTIICHSERSEESLLLAAEIRNEAALRSE